MIGERIRQRRLELNISQVRLEELSGVSQSTISRLESGDDDENISARRLAAIARVLNCSTDWLLGETDNPDRR